MTVAEAPAAPPMRAGLTAFPRIEASYCCETVPRSEGASKDIIMLSWAMLLHGYVPGDVVSFTVDTDIVTVDFSNGAVERRPVDGKPICGNGSAIYYSTAPPVSTLLPPIYVFLDEASKKLKIAASQQLLPVTHVPALCAQLSSLIKSSPTSPLSQAKPYSYIPDATTSAENMMPDTSTTLSILNHPAQFLPGPRLLHELVLQSPTAKPDGLSQQALDFLPLEGGVRQSFTYSQLDKLSTRFARKLHLNSGRSNIVPILLPQSPKLYVALLGILKAGGAFAPLQLDAPVDRIKFVVGDVDAQIVVADPSFASKLSWDGCPRVVYVDEDDVDIASVASTSADHQYTVTTIHPTSPAYVMYTSGSTGTPKGVTISHSAAAQSLLAHEKHIPAYNRFLQFASPSFDVFVFEVFFTFFRGAALIGCARSRLLSDIVDVVNRMDVDALELTPTVLGELVVLKDRIPKVKVVLTIGEMLTRHIVDEFGDGLLHGMYGPTEAAIHCTLAPNFRKGGAVGNAGIPFDTVSAFILGPAVPGQDVTVLPMGWVGELAVGGFQLADGYLNRPEQTKDAFIDTKYGKLYRTGDRARMHPGGTIECFGRISSGQVKLRGQRVELGEVEEAIRKTQGVKGVVASVIDGNLVAFVGCGSHVTETTIREAAKKWLPGYMVPNTVITMAEIPKLSSGKADRKRLEKDFMERRVEYKGDESEDSMNEVERTVASAVMEVLKGVTISRESSFIASGLDSLLAIRVCSKLRGFGFLVDTADILRADSAQEVAHLISHRSENKSTYNDSVDSSAKFQKIREAGQSKLVDLGCINFEDVEDILPCTPLQEAMLAETMRDPAAYSNWILLELPTSLTDSVIESAFRKVIHRNEILRTGFIHLGHESGMFAQVVWDTSRVEQFKLANSLEKEKQFDIDGMLSPPLRVSLVRNETTVYLNIHIHHALYDGWSWDHVLKDFNRMLTKDRGSIVPNRPQFRDIVSYHLKKSVADSTKSEAFWKQALANAPNSKLPNFHGFSGVEPGVSKEKLILQISRNNLEKSARELGVSPQVIIQASWAYILSIYLHSSDVIFGTVVSGRTIPLNGIEDIIGPCISTLPMRVFLGDKTKKCTEFLREIHEFNRLLLSYGDLDLRQIRKLCDVGTGAFDTLLIWQQTTLEDESEAVPLIKQVDSIDRLEFALLLEAEPSEKTVTLNATYRVEILPPTQLHLLLSQLDHVVSSIVSSPFVTLNTLSSGLDESLLSIELPQSITPSDDLPSLARLVERTASRRPNAIALEFALEFGDHGLRKTQMTYSELNVASNKLAHQLISIGVNVDDLVCAFMEKSPLLYITILAIIKSGAGYLAITPNTPLDKTQKMLTDGGIRVCVTTSDISTKVRSLGLQQIIEADKAAPDRFPSSNPAINIDPSSLAYAVFTSESTGVPKGVAVTHRNIVTNIMSLTQIYPYTERSKLLQFCSQAFDVSVFEIFFTWTTGMCLCSGTKDTLLRDFEGVIDAFKVTHLSLTPTVAALIDPTKVPTVEMLVTAGEAMTLKVFKGWVDRGLYQGYGPSEVTNICTMNPTMSQSQNVNNLGRALDNTSTFILTEHDEFELVPRGGVGELCFGGTQVAREYLNMPELTSRRFISHPKHGKIYRSGDLGRFLPDGSIEFLGRQDDEVKLRGHRVELGEINSILVQHESISDAAAVTITTTEDGAVQIVSFVVPKISEKKKAFEVITPTPEISNIISDAFQTMSSRLAAYMIPSSIVAISTIPMTTQGKVDKKQLQQCYSTLDVRKLVPFGAQESKKDDGDDKWTPTEVKLAHIIAQLVKVPSAEVQRSTSIFRLGLDSISTIHLSRQIFQAGFKRLDVSEIMQHPTVNGLAALIDRQTVVTNETNTNSRDPLQEFADAVRVQVLEELKLNNSEIKAILPCTHLQEAMLTERAGENKTSYYNHTTLELRADPEKLKNAWEIAMKRNDILRTCFCVTSHQKHAYAQVVLRTHPLPWREIELQNDEQVKSAVNETIETMSSTLNIGRPPLAFTLLRSPQRNLLIMTTHHSLYDGFALDLLLEEVQMAYNGSELPIRSSFSSVLDFIENCDMSKADTFWKATMDGYEPVQFPDLTGKSNSHKTNLTGMATQSMKSSRSLGDIEDGCKQLSTSLLALGHSVWARLLAAHTGETDICFGNVVSGRTIPVPGVETVIAPCFNTIPVRVQLTSSTTNTNLMQALQRANAEVLPFQHTPLRRIMSTLHTEGQMLFDTLFILQYGRETAMDDLWEIVDDRGEMDFAVVLEFVPNRRRNLIEFFLHFRRTTMNENTAGIILQQLDRILCSSIDAQESFIGNYEFLQESLLSVSNSPSTLLPGLTDTFLHTFFERKAEADPEAVALEFLNDDGTVSKFTYEAFNKAANQIAHELLRRGVSRDEAIPICLEKSPRYYICILAILKAGSAFTPIDPSAPSQRKAFMLQELGARFVITNNSYVKDLPAVEELEFIILENLHTSLPVTNPTVRNLLPRNLAYRLYTSGSTGLPKAVSIEIESALQTIRASRSILPWTPQSRLLQFAAITFDMCYYDCFMAWNYGFTLCSAGKSQLLGDLEGTIKKMNITMLDLTPTVASTLSASNLPDVELLYCIGEAMPQSLINDWENRCVNSYGPTEAAMCCTIVPVDRTIKSANIGAPFPTTSLHILSRDNSHTVPKLGSGELCIGGSQLAREYHNNPQLTQEKFIIVGSQRLYRTGDIARMLENGTFEFIGRLDDQVKIRGLRVELDEINYIIKNSHDNIKEAATIVLRHSVGAKEQLVTFLALEGRKKQGTSPIVIDDQQLKGQLLSDARNAAEKALPAYMVPGVMLVIDHIPLSAAGKVDKKALMALFAEQNIESFNESATQESQEEWSIEEAKARKILADISQHPVEKISKSSTIYQIGLDSISAAQVAMSLRKEGFMITVIDILECPSIKQLSSRLVRQSSGSRNPPAQSPILTSFKSRFTTSLVTEYSLSPDQISVFPCTSTQAGMLSQFIRSDGTLYFNHYLYQLSSDVNVELLRQTWARVMDENDILRAGFYSVDDAEHSFAIVVHSKNSVQLPWTVIHTSTDKRLSAIEEQKSLLASRCVQDLGLPPWHLTLFISRASTELLFSAHHALYDAQSLELILNTVKDYYLGNAVGPSPHFAHPLGRIVEDGLDVTKLDGARLFWLKQLEGSTISRFPNLNATRVQSQKNHVAEQVSTWKLSQIETASQRLGYSLHAVAQAAWARILSAYMGEPQVTFGVVLSGRTGIPDAEATIFPCLTTIPTLGTVIGSNQDLVARMQDSSIKALQYQHTPLRFIQRWFDHPDQSFFDSIFVYQKTASQRVSGEPKLWTTIDENAYVDYSVSIEVEPSEDDCLIFRATCRDNVLPQEQSKILIQQLDAALIDILQNPQNECTDFSYFPDWLLSIHPPSYRELPSDVRLVHQFVEKHCDLIPNRVALEFATSITKNHVEKQQWTYRQLDMEANKVANFLLSCGVKTGGLVGVCFDKSAEASIAIVGILKAGCGYVALDPTAPIDRKAFIVKDSGAQCILTMARFANPFRERVDVGVYVVGEEDGIKRASTARPYIRDLTPESLCYCLYTSGTTGTPKGCEITHENTVQAMLAFQRLFKGRWDKDSRFLQFASFHFDVSVLEQFWSWSVGVCVTSTPRDLLFEDLSLAISKLEITHLDLTPSLAALLDPAEVPSLLRGVFIVGGEALKQDVLDVWGRHGVLHNGYGPTEVTIGCTMLPQVPANGKASNIGPQFDNVGSFVMIPNTNKPTLKGAVGELCVSGKLVGKGYLKRPDLTQEKFPHLEQYGERIYRTGDLVRVLHNRCFDFLGRADDQVKLRGQRLEIGEINAVIKDADPKVKAVATLVLKHAKQQRDQLVSFVAIDDARTAKDASPLITTGEYSQLIGTLLKACKKRLPVYMVPTHFLPLSEIPLSVNNKVDNKRLTQLYMDTSLEVLQSLAYREEKDRSLSVAEARIQKILAEITNIKWEDIKRSSTIFELGMDSISVVGLARKLKKNGFNTATVSLIMQNSSLAKLAHALSETTLADSTVANNLEDIRQKLSQFSNKNTSEVCKHLGIAQEKVNQILPCSALQQGMILRFIDSTDSPYFVSFKFELMTNTDLEKLKKAWTTVIRSTDILRTCFCDTADGHAQIILKETEIDWKYVGFCQESELDNVLEKEKKYLARLNRSLRSPPIYFRVVHTPSRTVLALNIFHAIYDGNSIPLILHDVEEAYHSRYHPRPHQFPEVIPYILACNLKEAEVFWKHHLLSKQFISLPRSNSQTSKEITINRPLSISGSMIDEGCKLYGCTAQSLVQSAWATVLTSWVGKDTTFGIVVSGRTLPLDGVETTIGPVFNTIPCYIQPRSSSRWRDLVSQAHKFNSTSIPFHHTPLALIRKWLAPPAGTELFESLFVFQRAPKEQNTTHVPLWKILESNVDVDFPLSVEIDQDANGNLAITLSAGKDIMSEEMAMNLVSETEATLTSLLTQPDSTPALVDVSVPDSTSTLHVKDAETSWNGGEFEWTTETSTIRRIVATLAGLEEDEFTEDASIFELGLDSIEAIKLSARLRAQEINISVSTIMKNPTIKRLYAYLHAETEPQKVSDDPALRDFQKQARKIFPEKLYDAIYPTTPLQEGMVAETLISNYKFYYNHDVQELDDNVDIERLHKAWDQVIQSNPILRTSFFQADELGIVSPHTFGQVIHKKFDIPWTQISLSAGDDLWQEIDEIMEESARAADLLKRPPLSIKIIKTEKKNYLVFSISHALYDGWSLGLLHEDLHLAYTNSLAPRPSPIPLLETILRQDPVHSKQFWRELLQGAESSEFPVICNESEPPGTHRDELSSKLNYTKAANFCKRLGITVQTLVQGCFGLLLAHYIGKADVLFGTVLSGRDTDNAEETMFPSMNSVPVRVVARGSYKSMLQIMQENTGNVLNYQHTPLRQIQKLVKRGKKKLFDTLFIYQRGGNSPQYKRLWESVLGTSDIEYNVCVEMERVDDSLIWRTACKSTVISAKQALEMLHTMDSLLCHMVDNADYPSVSYDNNKVQFGNTPPVQIRSQLDDIEPEETKHDPNRPWSPLELKVRKVLATVSQLPEADLYHTQTIFHLGLDSISAISVSSELRKEGIILGVAEILRGATIEKIAQAVEEKERSGEVPGAVIDTDKAIETALTGIDINDLLERRGIKKEILDRVMPATPGQIYMLSAWQNHNGGMFMSTFSFKSPLLDSERLQTAWQMLVEEQSILRTTFISTNDESIPILQLVFSEAEAQFETQEMTIWGQNDQEFVMSEVSREQQRNISLRLPPVRLKLINTPEGSFVLLSIHHALYDGVSLPLLLKKLRKIYKSLPPPEAKPMTLATPTPLVSGPLTPKFESLVNSSTPTEAPTEIDNRPSTPPTPPESESALPMERPDPSESPPPTLADLVAFTSSRDRSKQETFWAKYLEGASSTLISSRADSNKLTHVPKDRTSIFNPAISKNGGTIEEQCRKHGMTIQSLCLASFAKVYANVLKPPGDDIVVGVYLSNRHFPINPATEHLYNLTAPTLNLLPVRIRRPKSTGLQTLARRIQKDLLEISNAENSAGVSVADVERWTRAGKDAQIGGVKVDTWFNFLRLPGTDDVGNNDEDDDEDDETWSLEVVRPVLPATATEAKELSRSSSSESLEQNSNSAPVGTDMLGTNLARKHIMHNLDIEVAVSGGNIALGAFARADLMDFEEVENMVSGIGKIIDSAFEN